MIRSNCVCKTNATFTAYIVYNNETVFKEYDGSIIGKCNTCGILKTFPSGKNKQFDPFITKSEDYENRRKEFESLFSPIIAYVEKYTTPRSTILDVGCSSGILLTLLKRKKYDVYGIEPNKQAYLFAKKKLKKNIFPGTLLPFSKKTNKKFDCIMYNHVLEHIENINQEFRLISRLLKKNGVLIVGVPNTDNIVFKIRQKYWEYLLPNEHIWHFDTNYLKKYLQVQKYKILDTSFKDDERKSYPFHKKIYFTLLAFLNRIMHTGEAVLIVASPSFPRKRESNL